MPILLIATVLCFGHSFCFGMDTATSTTTQKTCSPKSLLKQCIKFVTENQTVGIKNLPLELQVRIEEKSKLLEVMKESNNNPEKALFLAIERNYDSIIKNLVAQSKKKLAITMSDKGLQFYVKKQTIATLDITNSECVTPLEKAIIENKLSIAEQLIDSGATACTKPLTLAATFADEKIIMIALLINRNLVNMDKEDTSFTPFMRAADTINIPKCKALLNIPTTNIMQTNYKNQQSALRLAIEYATEYNKPDKLRSFFELLERRIEWRYHYKTFLTDTRMYDRSEGPFDFYLSPIQYAQKNNKHEIVSIIQEYRPAEHIERYIKPEQKNALLLQVAFIKKPGIIGYNPSGKHGVISLNEKLD